MPTDLGKHMSEALPWYVNGTLAPAERAEVEHHLHACDRCREELAWLSRLGGDMRAGVAEPSGDLGLQRLLDRIGSERNVVPLRRRERPRWFMPALALAASVLVAQTLVIGVLLVERDQTYRTLGGERSAQGTLLQVTFMPTATEAQIRELIGAVGADIVAGPGALGVYTLAVPPDQADAAVLRLEAAPAVVSSVSRAPR